MNTSPNIFIIVSEYHSEITNKLHQGAQSAWHRITQSPKPAATLWVPGAVEIPMTASWIATEHTPDAIVCLGCVIRGETDHFEVVCQQVSHGIQHVKALGISSRCVHLNSYACLLESGLIQWQDNIDDSFDTICFDLGSVVALDQVYLSLQNKNHFDFLNDFH